MEVTNKFDKKFAGSWSISSNRLSRIYPKTSIPLRENLRSIKVLSHNAAVAGSSGLTRAAAGAVLGFLVAGPVGTVLGAGAGAGGAKRGTLDTYSIIVSFKSGEVILGDVTAFELEALREYLPRPDDTPPPSAQQTVPAQPIVLTSAPNPPSKVTKASSGLPPAIKGRKTKRMPMSPSPLVAWLGDNTG
jgi:hypothetical protein